LSLGIEQAENLEKCYRCDSPYDPNYTKGNLLFVCRNCMSQHRERESLDGRGAPFKADDDSCTGDEDCWCLLCMEKMPDDEGLSESDDDEAKDWG
jgi:TPP-dependent indolepyruvate ferredoxin oxidoreductase alpha subunit